MNERDYIDAAQELGCEVAAIKAVAKVESRGDPFFKDGSPVILFEAHIFSRLTGGKYNVSHPNLSCARWNKSLYYGGVAEHKRLQRAAALDRNAALQSASWGMFQIMGFNWRACGFKTLQDFINAMYQGESGQLRAFVGFIKSQGLDKFLQKKKWAEFAKRYNGPLYKENNYDIKLEQAYKSYLH